MRQHWRLKRRTTLLGSRCAQGTSWAVTNRVWRTTLSLMVGLAALADELLPPRNCETMRAELKACLSPASGGCGWVPRTTPWVGRRGALTQPKTLNPQTNYKSLTPGSRYRRSSSRGSAPPELCPPGSFQVMSEP